MMNRSKLRVALALLTALCVLLPIGFADNPPTTYIVTQDQASVLFYQDGKLASVEPLAKGTAIRAEGFSGDMVLTTYNGKPAYVQLKFLTIQDSVLVVAGDNTELFYYNDSGPTGLERLAKGVQITVEKQAREQVFTTYRGKPAYIKRQLLVTPQEFAGTAEKEASIAREKAEKILADAREKADQVLADKMERDIKQLRTRVLNPQTSSPVAYYDQVITNEFRKFIATYPHSPHEAEVLAQINDWQAERDRVAAGSVKYAGDWMSKSNCEKYYRWDQALAFYRDGERQSAQNNWATAVQKFDAVLALNHGGGIEIATQRQLAVALTKWLAVLSHDLQVSTDKLASVRTAFQQAQAAVQQAQGKIKTPAQSRAVPVPSMTGIHAGAFASNMRAKDAMDNSQAEFNAARSKLDDAKAELDSAQAANDKLKQIVDQVKKRVPQDSQKVAKL